MGSMKVDSSKALAIMCICKEQRSCQYDRRLQVQLI